MAVLLFIIVLIMITYYQSRINNLEFRLRRLENGGTVQNPKPSAPPPTPVQTQAVAASAVPGPSVQSAPAVHSGPAVVSNPQTSVQSKPENGLEFEFGGKFFTIVGAIAVLLGVGFFLRYAINQNLISESMRVVLGIVAGLALIITGEVLRKKYEQYSHILQGTGIGVFYLTFFAAFALYGLIGQAAALVLMCGVTVIGIVLAIRSNSQNLAGVAEFGAYLTPFLSNALSGNMYELFIYLFVLNIGMLLLAMYMSWRGVTLGALLGTSIVFVSWYTISYTESMWPVALTFATLYFLTFLAANIYRYFVQKHASDPNDLALVLFNPIFYFLIAYALLQKVDMDYTGALALVLSAVYFFLGSLVPEDNQDAKTFHFGVSSILFLIGVPILLDKQWVTIAWTSFAVLLLYYGTSKALKSLEFMAHLLIMISFLRFIMFDAFTKTDGAFILNARAFNLFVVVGLMALGAYFVHKQSSNTPVVQNNSLSTDKGMEVLAIQAYILIVAWVGFEFVQFEYGYLIGMVWTALALLIVSVSRLTNDLFLRAAGYVTAMLAIFRVAVYDGSMNPANYTPIFNTRVFAFVGLAVALGCLMRLVNKMKNEISKDEYDGVSKIFFFGTNLVLLWVLSLEVASYYDKQIYYKRGGVVSLENAKRVTLSVAWSLYAALMLVIGIAWKSTSARLLSIALFVLVIFKVFLYDTANLSDFYRFMSFLSLGLVLLVAGYLYNRYKERIDGFIKAD